MTTKTGTNRKFINQRKPLAGLAEQYLAAMLAMERNRAQDLVLKAIDSGTDIRDIYSDVFQSVQYEIGWLWETGKISVGQEHYCTNATQLIMSMLYPRIFSGSHGGRRMIGACVEGELHELGLRMLTDFFQLDGWETDFVGANTPAESIVRMLEEKPVSILAVGVTMHYHIEGAQKLIAAIRSSKAAGVRVLVGGYTFTVNDSLWKTIGADGSARDAREAIRLADTLVSKENVR